jgi:hypothetical protein
MLHWYAVTIHALELMPSIRVLAWINYMLRCLQSQLQSVRTYGYRTVHAVLTARDVCSMSEASPAGCCMNWQRRKHGTVIIQQKRHDSLRWPLPCGGHSRKPTGHQMMPAILKGSFMHPSRHNARPHSRQCKTSGSTQVQHALPEITVHCLSCAN